VLVGASSGGYVAQQVAVTSPDRVAGLVLAGAPRDLRGRPPFAAELEKITDPVDPEWVRTFTAGFTDLDRLPSWYVDLMVDDALRLPASIWMATFNAFDYPDTGHLVLEEQPAQLAADVLSFIAGLPGQGDD
jgi:pimeloyl-ACP methyl ester carboxylesterase